jgi:hypothetical protein
MSDFGGGGQTGSKQASTPQEMLKTNTFLQNLKSFFKKNGFGQSLKSVEVSFN